MKKHQWRVFKFAVQVQDQLNKNSQLNQSPIFNRQCHYTPNKCNIRHNNSIPNNANSSKINKVIYHFLSANYSVVIKVQHRITAPYSIHAII